MKYNEAIDMILDGGECWIDGQNDIRMTFDSDGFLIMYNLGKREEYRRPVLSIYAIEKDWIVEKDGVVYEQKPNGRSPLDDLYESYKELHNVINKRELEFVRNYVEEQELKQKTIIADEVDEDWLEKKMLCFVRRHALLNPRAALDKFKAVLGTCCDTDCPFCFPEEDLIKKTIRDMQPPPTAKEASEKAVKNILQEANKVLEKPHEKVTVDEIMNLIYTYSICMKMWDGPDSFTRLASKLEKKLTYLVSLQEK